VKSKCVSLKGNGIITVKNLEVTELVEYTCNDVVDTGKIDKSR